MSKQRVNISFDKLSLLMGYLKWLSTECYIRFTMVPLTNFSEKEWIRYMHVPDLYSDSIAVSHINDLHNSAAEKQCENCQS